MKAIHGKKLFCFVLLLNGWEQDESPQKVVGPLEASRINENIYRRTYKMFFSERSCTKLQ